MSWEDEGLALQTKELVRIANKLDAGKPLNGFEKGLWRSCTGDVDYADMDAGEERVIKYQE